jgi:hypothetical protein
MLFVWVSMRLARSVMKHKITQDLFHAICLCLPISNVFTLLSCRLTCFAALAITLTTAKAISSDHDEVKYT